MPARTGVTLNTRSTVCFEMFAKAQETQFFSLRTTDFS